MITFIEKILGEKMKKSTKELAVRTKHWLTKARKKNCMRCCIFCEWWDMCKWEIDRRRKKDNR
jgi:hypothetical protein